MVNNIQQASQEITHITEELYKKNLELSLNNSTLSILQKIDELILGSVTDPKQIAQTVTSLIIKEAIGSIVAVLLLDKQKANLQLLAIDGTSAIEKTHQFFPHEIIPLTDAENPVVQCILQKKMITFEYKENEINEMIYIFPLIVRNEPIGILWMKLQKAEEIIIPYQNSLIERFANVVGIAINDALLYQDIQQANQSLKQLDSLKDEFVALASHELRNPMVSIKLYLGELLDQPNDVGTLTVKQKQIIQYSYESTQRLLRLVTDMLDVSKIESGKLTLQIKSVNIVQLITESLTEITPAALKQQVNISFERPTNPIGNVLADSEKIKEVIINLLSNAIKFSSAGGRVVISIKDNQYLVTICISDTGRGIPPESITELFQKYVRLHGTSPQEKIVEGTGLGLYLSKRIVELHQGTMKAESEGWNKGSTFSFTLPKAP